MNNDLEKIFGSSEHLYKAQMRDGVSVSYEPKYPEKTKEDISIWCSDIHQIYSFTANDGITHTFNNCNKMIAELERYVHPETGVRVFNTNGDLLTPKQLAEYANMVHRYAGGKGDVFTPDVFIPNNENYRLGNWMCDCGCNDDLPGSPSLGEFVLLPLTDEGVKEGGKAYMKCRNCGAYSHL